MSDVPSAPLDSGSAKPVAAYLERRQRRRLLAKATIRVLATTVLVLVVYFQIPVGRDPTTWGAVALVASLIAFLVAVGFQIRRIVDAPLPQLRAIETVATAIPVFVVIFALVYVSMSEAQADSFNQPVTRITGLYFTVTVFTSVGFGDVVARTDTARAVVTVQMLLDLVLLGGLVRAIIGASRVGLARRRAEAEQAAAPHTEPSSNQ